MTAQQEAERDEMRRLRRFTVAQMRCALALLADDMILDPQMGISIHKPDGGYAGCITAGGTIVAEGCSTESLREPTRQKIADAITKALQSGDVALIEAIRYAAH